MKRIAERISFPLLLLIGLTLVWPQTVEAGKWRRYARRVDVHRPYHVAPPIVHAPPVRAYAPPLRVYAPGVSVRVGPGVQVYAPGVGVNVRPGYPFRHGVSSYYRW
jgi:hypothetical protein